MKFKLKTFFTAVLIGLIALQAHAALVWEEGRGWYVEGGALEPYFGDKADPGNALELMNLAREEQEKGAYFQALRYYGRVADSYAGSIYAPEALYQRSRIHTARHQYDKAYEELDRIAELYPDYPNFNRVVGQKFEIASQLMEGKRPYYWGFIPGFRDEVAALDYFEGIIRTAPYSRYAPVALMNIALIAKSKGKTEEAIDALDRLITNYPKSVLAPDAYLNLAKTFASLVDGAYYDQGSTREAMGYFQDFMILYPDDENIATAEEGLQQMRDTLSRSRLIVGEFYWRYRDNPTAATVFLNDAITVAPDSAAAKEARALLDKIEAGTQPPGTPVDWLFGKYRNPDVKDYQEQTQITEKREQEQGAVPAKTDKNTPVTPASETVSPAWN